MSRGLDMSVSLKFIFPRSQFFNVQLTYHIMRQFQLQCFQKNFYTIPKEYLPDLQFLTAIDRQDLEKGFLRPHSLEVFSCK